MKDVPAHSWTCSSCFHSHDELGEQDVAHVLVLDVVQVLVLVLPVQQFVEHGHPYSQTSCQVCFKNQMHSLKITQHKKTEDVWKTLFSKSHKTCKEMRNAILDLLKRFFPVLFFYQEKNLYSWLRIWSWLHWFIYFFLIGKENLSFLGNMTAQESVLKPAQTISLIQLWLILYYTLNIQSVHTFKSWAFGSDTFWNNSFSTCMFPKAR